MFHINNIYPGSMPLLQAVYGLYSGSVADRVFYQEMEGIDNLREAYQTLLDKTVDSLDKTLSSEHSGINYDNIVIEMV